jgi:hypothetical protein
MSKTESKTKALTDDELLILDSLSYYVNDKNLTGANKNLGSIVDKLSTNTKDANISPDQLVQLKQMVHDDPKLSNLVIKNVYAGNDKDLNNHNNNMIYFQDPSDGGQYLIFAGTGKNEWPDDFTGILEANPEHKTQMKQWVDGLHIKNPPGVTVSGHSDGGNDAMYITVTNGQEVNRCVSFDGEGFGADFMTAYADEIAANKFKITAYDEENDPVSALFPSIAAVTYYIAGSYNKDGTASLIPSIGHSISWLFAHDSNGKLLPSIGSMTLDYQPWCIAIRAILSGGINDTSITRAALQQLGQEVGNALNTGQVPTEALLSAVTMLLNEAAAAPDTTPFGSDRRDFSRSTEQIILDQISFNQSSDWIGKMLSSLFAGSPSAAAVANAQESAMDFAGELTRASALGQAAVTSIFDAEYALDEKYCAIFQQHCTDVEACANALGALTDGIEPY